MFPESGPVAGIRTGRSRSGGGLYAPPKYLVRMRTILGLAMFVALVALTSVGSSAAAPPLKALAPADEYFGRMKLSFLGINNTFQHAAIEAGPHTTSSSIVNKVDFAMEALNDWQNRYPRDPHLARSYFLGELTFKKIWIQKYQDKAWAYMQRLVTVYPTTFFGKTVKTELAKGFTQHYYAEPVPCGTEPPPATSPEPTVTDNGKYKISIEPVPCVPVSAPSEEPSMAPTSEPSPATTDEPSAAPTSSPSAI